jgi:5-methylcytosine-specific restriction endonuclease McrA
VFLELTEVIQAGDVFLVSFRCPNCGQKCLSDFRQAECRSCDSEFTDRPVKVPTHRSHTRLLVGTERKPKAGLGKKQIRILLEQQGNECGYCGAPLFSEFHIEHIIPLGFGGTNNLSNLCIACPPCNLAAGGLVFQDFYQKQQYVIMKRFKKTIVQ